MKRKYRLVGLFALLFMVWAVACMTTTGTTAQSAEKQQFLADRHAEQGGCDICHEDAEPAEGDWVDPEKCLGCHDGWDTLAVATESHGMYNPHKSHLGEPDCSICHKGHEPSVNYCSTCHKTLDPSMK
ncbi:cytochrome c3 family protein [Desulfovibrio sp. OttesenSCG-928-C06]|nr:cytochrome c3 family protein [Desulfovibrio sp. OttesenSCG-928-C06]